jgi:iron-sulfur cluster assembly protein
MADAIQADTQRPDTQAPALTITEAAASKVRELLQERDLEGFALRVFVQGGGCSGFQYGMGFEENFYAQDKIIETSGVKLVIDPTSLMYMAGAEIDYVDSLMGGGFAIHNPNAVSTCGCGHSFRTEGSEAGAHGAGGCSSCG